MGHERRVMWVEGTFLRQHHFQQQERWVEAQLRDRIAALAPFFWGMRAGRPDESTLRSGRFAMARFQGLLPDGTPVSFPDVEPAPPAVEVDRDVANQTVYMVAPAVHAGQPMGAVRRAGGGPVSTRYVVEETHTGDALNDAAPDVELHVGTLNLRYEIGERNREGFVAMPVARIAEVGTDRVVKLDPDFIPPVLAASASPVLEGYLKEFAAGLDARAAALSGVYSQVGGSGASAIQEFMLLQLVNEKSALFNQMRDVGQHHPEELHRLFVATAAALAAHTEETTRRPPAFPRYDHDDLTATMRPVVDELRRSLAHAGQQKAVRIPLRVSRHQIHFGHVPYPEILEKGRLIIVAKSAMDGEDFRQSFPRQVTVGSVNDIREIIAAADRSVRVRPFAHPPQELPRMAGWLYLEVDRSSPSFAGIEKSRSIAIHHSARFPELDVQLWGIRD